MSTRGTIKGGNKILQYGLFFSISLYVSSQVGEASLTKKVHKPYYTVEFQDFQNNVETTIDTSASTSNVPSLPEISIIRPEKVTNPFSPEERPSGRASKYAQAILKAKKGNRSRDKKPKILREGWERRFQNQTEKFEKKLVCYYTTPTFQDRPFAVFPEQIDPTLCTHIILGFARVVNSTIQPSDLKDFEFYNRTLSLKNKNKKLKVLLSIGDQGPASGFPLMVATNGTRSSFIAECFKLLDTYPFDGFDLDWEFPAYFGKMEEKEQFTAFLEELRAYSERSGRPIILSAAVAAPKVIVDISYDIGKLASILDFVSIMAYDFHFYEWYTPLTGPNAPLNKSDYDLGITATLNTAWAAKYWYQCGMPANKIIVGAPTYGHTYKLVDKSESGYNALAVDQGSVGGNGYISYPEVCDFLQLSNTVKKFDNQTEVPYAYNTGTLDWVSYDDEISARKKAEFVKDFNLGGVMIWCINTDDAWKMCNTSQVAFPIISTYKTELFSIEQL